MEGVYYLLQEKACAWSITTVFDRITFDKNIMGGRACIRGMRIPVSLIINMVANGMPHDEILQEYPDLDAEDIRDALQYAAFLSREEIVNS